MAEQKPSYSELTESQSQAISKFGALKTFLASPIKPFKNITKEKQMSAYDFLVRLAIAMVGISVVDKILGKFLDKIFANDGKLEKAITKALANSISALGITLKDGMTNEEWIAKNAPIKIDRVTLVTLIITLIFGPKNKMNKAAGNNATDDSLLNEAVCTNKIFSLTANEPSDGEMEYNTILLKQRLKEGVVSIEISCQSVDIKLPENFEETLGVNSGYDQQGKNPNYNASLIFNNLDLYVNSQVQAQNKQKNSDSAGQTFRQYLIQKIFQVIITAIKQLINPILQIILMRIQKDPKNQNKTINDLIPSACELSDSCKEDDNHPKKAFGKTLLNILYAILIALLFKELVKLAKKLILKLIKEKAIRKSRRRVEKAKQQMMLTGGNPTDKASALEQNAQVMADITKFTKETGESDLK